MPDVIFIGDEEKDRKTAMNANCKFIWIQRTEKNEESIGNLYELLRVLKCKNVSFIFSLIRICNVLWKDIIQEKP